ncbi:MAG: O-methyltransferase [Halanaeroarchaeum sp.]
MNLVLDEDVAEILSLAHGRPAGVLQRMEAHARDRNFPIVGPDVGALLRVVATMVDAERVFEFGSGFGYSGAWFAGAIPETGEIHLTDYDEDNAATARAFLRDGGYEDRATVHVGDAMDVFGDTSGAFDVVLIDHEKRMYTDAFHMAADRVAEGGVIVADNMLAGPTSPDAVRRVLAGDGDDDDVAAAIGRYIETVRDDERFETALVPLGEGVALSVKR